MIRLLVVDDHPIVRAGLVAVLAEEPGLEIVGEAADGDEAVRIAAETHPDVVLMDLRMPGVDGVAATARLAAGEAGTPAPRVLILTTYETDEQILAAVEAGAGGYLLKAAPRAEIVAAIRSVAAGQSALSPQVAVRLVERMRRPAAEPVLTPRELDVLRRVAQGRSNRQIGVDLGIGEATVKTHLQKAFDKLDAPDRTRAVTRAMELGLLPWRARRTTAKRVAPPPRPAEPSPLRGRTLAAPPRRTLTSKPNPHGQARLSVRVRVGDEGSATGSDCDQPNWFIVLSLPPALRAASPAKYSLWLSPMSLPAMFWCLTVAMPSRISRRCTPFT